MNAPVSAVEALQRLDLSVGDKSYSFTHDQLLKEWKIEFTGPSGTMWKLTSPPSIRGEPSLMPWRNDCLNWPGDWAVLQATFPATLAISILVGIAVIAVIRRGQRRKDELWLSG